MNEEEKNEELETQEESVEATSLSEKCEEYLTGWKRALADYDNLKKDLIKERDNIRSGVKEDVARQLIGVLDNFDQAAKFQPKELDKEAQTWAMGLMHVRNQLEGVMTDLGLDPFGQAGDMFDPNLHQAAADRSEEDKPDQSILEVSQRGWRMNEKIVRSATVIVNSIKDIEGK